MMIKKRVTRVAAAVAVAMGMGLGAQQAQAVNYAHNEVGEVLLFPYYSVRDGMEPTFTVVNTDDISTVAAKIQIKEGNNSEDVLDFYVILSPKDVFTWTMRLHEENGVQVVRAETMDNSCTVPMPIRGDAGLRYFEIDPKDVEGGVIEAGEYDRVLEGHVQVLAAGTSGLFIDGATGLPRNFVDIESTVAYLSKHIDEDENGVRDGFYHPRNCGAIAANWDSANMRIIKSQFKEPTNRLTGDSVLTHAPSGATFGLKPAVLANFENPVGNDGAGPYGTNLIEQASLTFLPNLTTGGLTATIFDDATAETLSDTFADQSVGSRDAISAVLMKSGVYNRFMTSGNDMTDWIVTFPTKKFHVDAPFVGLVPAAPFPTLWDESTNRAPVSINLNYTDNEEYGSTTVQPRETVCASPLPPFDPTTEFLEPIFNEFGEMIDCIVVGRPQTNPAELDYEVNVISFHKSSIFETELGNLQEPMRIVDGEEVGTLDEGWARLTFTNSALFESDNKIITFPAGSALPVIGAALHKDENGVSSVAHSYRGL
jgi:hypothetical protein